MQQQFICCRDGTNFRYLLNFLRTGKISLPDDEFLKNELIEEATYYNLQSFLNVLEEVEPKCSDSTLLSEEHQKVVNTWCGNPNQKWKLIYRVIQLACTLTNSIRQLEMDFHQLTFTINVIIKVQQ